MTRSRRGLNLTGGLLDCPPNVDPSSWTTNSLLDKIKPAPLPPACHCRPNSGPTDLGGCKPLLRWVGPDQVEAFCGLCLKPLRAGANKRRDQVRMIALSSMELGHLDIPDLIDAGWLVGDRPEPPQPDPAMAGMAWPTARAGAPQGVPDVEAIAAATAALDQAEGQQAWLEGVH